MLVRAVVNYIKNNQSLITRVVPVSGDNINTGGGEEPYILVGEEQTRGFRGMENDVTRLFIRVAYPTSYQDDLDSFILYRLRTLLHKKRIEVVNGDSVTHTVLYVTRDITDIRPAVDGYIYRDRVVEVPCRWR